MSNEDEDQDGDEFFTRLGNPDDPDGSMRGVIERLPPSALESPRRSTVPLLEFWKSKRWRRSLVNELEAGSTAPGNATFEFRVSSRCARCDPARRGGKDSFTDLMLELPRSIQAIEAKYKEGLYEDVDAWLQRGRDRSNRLAVLRHWLHLVGEQAGVTRSPGEVGALVYQMVHRTASACWLGQMTGKNQHVVHLLFGAGRSKAVKYREAIRRVKALLDPNGKITFKLVLVAMEETAQVAELYEQHRGGAPGVAEEVRGALLSSKALYRFTSLSGEEPG